VLVTWNFVAQPREQLRFGAERVAIEARGRPEVAHRDPDVVDVP